MNRPDELLKSKHCLYHYECDKNGNIRIVTLMNLLQNAAQQHISQWGYGVEEFAKQQLAWVTTKYSIKVTRYPRVNENFTITTWISETKKLTAIREFLITNDKGEVLAEVISKWALIDLAKKRPTEIPYAPKCDRSLFAPYFPPLTIKRVDYTKSIEVNFDHIDFNQHVNNSFYPLWATESVEPEFRLNHTPMELVISFQKETVYGDTVTVSTQVDDLNTVHRLVSKNTGNELTKVSIKWA